MLALPGLANSQNFSANISLETQVLLNGFLKNETMMFSKMFTFTSPYFVRILYEHTALYTGISKRISEVSQYLANKGNEKFLEINILQKSCIQIRRLRKNFQ